MKERWVRSIRGYTSKPGPWHLVAPGLAPWNTRSVCGVYPTLRNERRHQRPTDGALCPKCLKAAPPAVPADGAGGGGS